METVRNISKMQFMLQCQKGIAAGLEKSIEMLYMHAIEEQEYTLASEISPHYDVAISKLNTSLKLSKTKIDILTRALKNEE
jgi:hypothetical protein